MNSIDVLRSVLTEIVKSGRYGLSVACGPGTLDELSAKARLPHKRIRVSTAGQVRDAGFEVVSDPLPGFVEHALILFAAEPGDLDVARLTAVFGEPVANPFGGDPYD